MMLNVSKTKNGREVQIKLSGHLMHFA